MSDDRPVERGSVQEALEFEGRLRAVLEGFDRVRQLRGRFLDSMIEIEVQIDFLLCDLLRIEPERYDVARSTILAMPFPAKMTTLHALLEQEGLSTDVVKRLESLGKLRHVLAHARATRPDARTFDEAEPLVFVSYKNGKVTKFKVTERDLLDRMSDLSKEWNAVRDLRTELTKLRRDTTHVHVVGPSGHQWWEVRPAVPEDVQEFCRPAVFPETTAEDS